MRALKISRVRLPLRITQYHQVVLSQVRVEAGPTAVTHVAARTLEDQRHVRNAIVCSTEHSNATNTSVTLAEVRAPGEG